VQQLVIKIIRSCVTFCLNIMQLPNVPIGSPIVIQFDATLKPVVGMESSNFRELPSLGILVALVQQDLSHFNKARKCLEVCQMKLSSPEELTEQQHKQLQFLYGWTISSKNDFSSMQRKQSSAVMLREISKQLSIGKENILYTMECALIILWKHLQFHMRKQGAKYDQFRQEARSELIPSVSGKSLLSEIRELPEVKNSFLERLINNGLLACLNGA